MAQKKKTNGFDPNNPSEADLKQMNAEANEMMAQQQVMAEIQALDQKTKEVEQEALNKEHDQEITANNNPVSGGVIGKKEIEEAYQTLLKYKEYKADIEERFISNERIWKMEHWEVSEEHEFGNRGKDSLSRIKPRSAHLFNTILNKHADAMDNRPDANILPRSKDDEETAKQLSEIIPVILEQNDFDKTYSDLEWYKNKNGVGCYGVFWSNDKNNGLGDIDIKKVDVLSLYWKSGISNIQDSPNVFFVTMVDNDELKARFPVLAESNANNYISENDQFNYGESVDTSNQSALIDWYYKRRVRTQDENGIPKTETRVHLCTFCNGEVLYASENDPNFKDRGWYDHGKYPFVFDTLFPVEKNICGLGYIDILISNQMTVDKLNQAIIENAQINARPRYLSRGDGNINEEELLDTSKPIVHVDGSLDEASFKQIIASPLSPIYENVYLQKIKEMQDTSGNTPTSQGQTSSVTTASGIASLMDASGKLSRDATAESYRAFKEVIYLVIELIRQFYTVPRCFRILGETGENEFVEFDNRGLLPQSQGMIPDGMGGSIDLGNRLPILDIEVKPQKKSAYSKETQNQTALQFYAQGFFSPQNADASLACLTMMDFDGIEKMRDVITRNGTMYEMLMQMQQQMMAIEAAMAGVNPNEMQQEGNQPQMNQPTGTRVVEQKKGSVASQAANNTRESTAPRT